MSDEVWLHTAYIDASLRLLGVPSQQALFVARDGRIKTRAERIVRRYGLEDAHSEDGCDLDEDIWRQFLADPKGQGEWQSSDFGFHDADGLPNKLIGVRMHRSDFITAFPLVEVPLERFMRGLEAVTAKQVLKAGDTAIQDLEHMSMKIEETNIATRSGAVGVTPIPKGKLRDWFADRVKNFAEKTPPKWQECHREAKSQFPQHRITKDMLLSVRREVAPHWRPGRR